MSDLASNRTAGLPVSRTGFLSHLSQARRVSGTAKVRGIWAFVSGVSLVPPNLELIEEYRNAEWRRQRRAITRAIGLAAETSGTNAAIMRVSRVHN